MVCTNIPKPENLRILKIITSLNITTFSLSKCLHIIVSLLSLHVFYINEYLILIFIFILYNTINLIVLPIIISVDRFSDAIPIYLILYIHTSRFLINLSTQSLLNNLFTATIIIHFTTICHRYIKSKFVYSFSYSNSFVNSLSEFLLSYTTSIALSAGLYEFNIDTYHYIQILLNWICSNTTKIHIKLYLMFFEPISKMFLLHMFIITYVLISFGFINRTFHNTQYLSFYFHNLSMLFTVRFGTFHIFILVLYATNLITYYIISDWIIIQFYINVLLSYLCPSSFSMDQIKFSFVEYFH